VGSKPDTKRRIVNHLKRVDGATATELAEAFGVTSTAVRQHLDDLVGSGLVQPSEAVGNGGRGRPAARWRLADGAETLFPDRHGDLTVELIQSIREALGEEALDAVIGSRSARQRDLYAAELDQAGTAVSIRAGRLAEMRSAEGYMAQVTGNEDGSLTLVEHHCPICEAASVCQALCRDELETFQALFEGQATVTREQHLLAGDQRCVYRINPSA